MKKVMYALTDGRKLKKLKFLNQLELEFVKSMNYISSNFAQGYVWEVAKVKRKRRKM